MTAPIRRFGLIALVASVALSACGQLGMKVGMQELERALSTHGDAWTLAVLGGPLLWTLTGLAAYAASLGCWILVLVRYPLSFAYPILSLSYGLVYLGAVFWPRLGEAATLERSLGTVAILAGVALVSMSRSRDKSI